VVSTVVLTTRERVRELGVFRAIGMTPRQVIVMVVCWVAGTGLVAGLASVALGVTLHRYLITLMASYSGNGVPGSFVHVYRSGELAALALAGLAVAVAGALVPAAWAASIRTVSALRVE
jgi:putative ABC transport system permease protein